MIPPPRKDIRSIMKIMFMGTPDFAGEILKKLISDGENVVAAVTQPDKPKGRGKQLTPPPVKLIAEEHAIPVLQPITLKDNTFEEELKKYSPELIIVAAYGKILPEYVLDHPKYGCINAHASLLPEYRGAAPIQRAMMDGKKTTGITAMYMEKGLDTGDMIAKREVAIESGDDFEALHDKLAAAAAELISSVIAQIKDSAAARLPAEKQNDALASYAAKIEKEDRELSFSDDCESLCRRIRALSPAPLAFTHTPDGKLMKIVKAEFAQGSQNAAIGTVTALNGGKISVACDGGTLLISEIIPEGKGKMNAADYIRGRNLCVGDILK